MENPSSPLDTLRQLKEMLDAGALTPAEFEVLKQRLVLAPAAPDAPVAPDAAPAAPLWAPDPPAANNAPAPPPAHSDAPGWRPALPAKETDAPGFEPAAEPRLPVAAVGGIAVAAADPRAAGADAPADADADALGLPTEPAERSSSLGLVLAIGAVLVFLAVVAYLGLTRPASEHIASTSQTAADSVAAAIETGPQVAPLPAAVAAAPETVRVAPTNPAPALPARPQAARQAAARDSAAPAVSPAAPDSAVRQ